MDKSNFKLKIPNILTIFRICLAPIVVVLFLVDFKQIIYIIQFSNNTIQLNLNVLLAGILFIISSFTDFLDGYLARKWKCVSNFGKFWDPIADKVLVSSTLICLAIKTYIPIWIPIIVIARDIIMDGIRLNAMKSNIVIPANIYGKIKTIIQMVAIIFSIYFSSTFFNSTAWWWYGVQNLLQYIGMIFSLISLIIYGIQYQKKIKQKQQLEKEKEKECQLPHQTTSLN